tara:strand:+ start:177 stop:806 length:630 start_codon:yes stop_codon:yes gene_type:complete
MNLNKIKRRDFVKAFSFLPFIGFGLSSRASKIFNIEEILEPRYLGRLDAPIKFIEFVSMTCSHCADFHINTLPKIKKKYIDSGKLRLELRDFPLDGLALRASAMARLIDPNKYYKFVDMLFKKQEKWSRSENPINELKKLGRLAGLEKTKIDIAIDEISVLEAIFKMRQQAEKKYNVQSTPSFVINEQYFLSGNLSVEKFEETFKKISI